MLENDARIIKVLNTVDARPSLKLNAMIEDAIKELQSKPFPSPTSRSIISARSHLANSRSKLIGMRIEILRELSLLKRTVGDLTDYALAKYNQYFTNNVKNQRSREAIINKTLNPITKKISRLESALEIINHVIGDFDSKAFAINAIIEAKKLGERES